MVANSIRWTIRDLTAMPDDGGWKRYEIIDGNLLVTRAPHFWHQKASSNINFELEAWSRRTKLGSAVQVPGVIFTPDDAVIPDVVWASQNILDNGLDEAGHFVIAPELMVEVLSQGELNELRDKEVKLKLYSLHGVREYWIVSWQMKKMEIYRRRENRLQLVSTLFEADTLTSPLLPAFSISVSAVFR